MLVPPPARILVVDDHAAVRAGIIALLDEEPGLRPVAAVGSVADALREAARVRPDVALLDYQLPDGDGLSLCLDLKRLRPGLKVAIYSAYADDGLAVMGLVAGVDALADKAAHPDGLCRVVRELANGHAPPPPALERGAQESAIGRLHPDDLPIFGMLAHGTPPEEIAATLAIDAAELTARRHAMLARLAGRRPAAV